MPALDSCLTIEDLKGLARRRVPKMFFDYADSGSWTETTYRDERERFREDQAPPARRGEHRRPHARDRHARAAVAMPVALAPTGLTGMQFADGEILAAKAAEKFGVPFTLSTMSICSIEDVAENTTRAVLVPALCDARPRLHRAADRSRQGRQMLGAGADHGSADPRPAPQGRPQRPVRAAEIHADATSCRSRPGRAGRSACWARSAAPSAISPAMSTNAADLSQLAAGRTTQFDPTLSWNDVGWVKERFGGRIIVKGMLDPEDAKQAVAHGADAIIVSNHGGRQLDGAPRRSGSCRKSSRRSAAGPRSISTAASAPARIC